MAFDNSQPRADNGQWSGGINGTALQASLARNPVRPHAGQKSVGTHKSRRKGNLTSAAQERVALMQRGDDKSYLGPARSR